MTPNLKQCIRRTLDSKPPDLSNVIEGLAKRKKRVSIAATHRVVEHSGGALERTGYTTNSYPSGGVALGKGAAGGPWLRLWG